MDCGDSGSRAEESAHSLTDIGMTVVIEVGRLSPKNFRQSTMNDALPYSNNFNQEITSLIGLKR